MLNVAWAWQPIALAKLHEKAEMEAEQRRIEWEEEKRQRRIKEEKDRRTKSLSYWVDSTLLATQPTYRHMPPAQPGYHEVVGPFIHRIGVENDSTIKITGQKLSANKPKKLDYAVVGDATTIHGLEAPYDEEATDEVLKVEVLKTGEDVISFWIANGNTDQFSNKSIEMATFE
ncbi:hypothetical protein [Oceanicoccus sp. KOV_DT_Chl]|uniref:hypothetical protein n=1 Tax=Oceanicoccus sp. KOV_DT_Chl TaxID=1904639 RepID=UPI000C7DF5FE|nr:hypothetical protein [Oceanicoccus sp. KOV_DT_Chl]